MCQATVYLGETKIAQDVIRLKPVQDGVRLETFFEEPMTVCGTLKEINFLKHSVLLTPIKEDDDE